jgi:hypothetical protein
VDGWGSGPELSSGSERFQHASDLEDAVGKTGLAAHVFSHPIERMDHGGVIPSAEGIADFD